MNFALYCSGIREPSTKMDGTKENFVYPTAFNPCLLKCYEQDGRRNVVLFNQTSQDTTYCQLAFKDCIFKGNGSTFKCDLMDAKDGGLPFLIVCDIMCVAGRDVSPEKYLVRHELVKLILQDDREYFDVHSSDNEFRLRPPLMMQVHDIREIFGWVLSNYYAVAKGLRFSKDSVSRVQVPDKGSQTFIVRKTKYSDIYELFVNGIEPAPGNNVAFIPNLEVSKRMRDLLRDRTSAPLDCTFDEIRQKYIPQL